MAQPRRDYCWECNAPIFHVRHHGFSRIVAAEPDICGTYAVREYPEGSGKLLARRIKLGDRLWPGEVTHAEHRHGHGKRKGGPPPRSERW